MGIYDGQIEETIADRYDLVLVWLVCFSNGKKELATPLFIGTNAYLKSAI